MNERCAGEILVFPNCRTCAQQRYHFVVAEARGGHHRIALKASAVLSANRMARFHGGIHK